MNKPDIQQANNLIDEEFGMPPKGSVFHPDTKSTKVGLLERMGFKPKVAKPIFEEIVEDEHQAELAPILVEPEIAVRAVETPTNTVDELLDISTPNHLVEAEAISVNDDTPLPGSRRSISRGHALRLIGGGLLGLTTGAFGPRCIEDKRSSSTSIVTKTEQPPVKTVEKPAAVFEPIQIPLSMMDAGETKDIDTLHPDLRKIFEETLPGTRSVLNLLLSKSILKADPLAYKFRRDPKRSPLNKDEVIEAFTRLRIGSHPPVDKMRLRLSEQSANPFYQTSMELTQLWKSPNLVDSFLIIRKDVKRHGSPMSSDWNNEGVLRNDVLSTLIADQLKYEQILLPAPKNGQEQLALQGKADLSGKKLLVQAPHSNLVVMSLTS